MVLEQGAERGAAPAMEAGIKITPRGISPGSYAASAIGPDHRNAELAGCFSLRSELAAGLSRQGMDVGP
jgi:hypothetical protein